MRKQITVFLSMILAVMVLGLGVLIYFRITPSAMNLNIGANVGSKVGRLLGSAEGYIQGRKDGAEDGKKAGLSAVDTQIEVVNKLAELQNLEVLIANVKISDMHSIGDAENPKFAVLYRIKGYAVFSVDFSKASIQEVEGKPVIFLPTPTGEVYFDQEQIEEIASYQKTSFTGSAEDGFYAYLNSMKEIQAASAETLNNYDSLIQSAEEAAERQVLELIGKVTLDSNLKEFDIRFTTATEGE